MDDKKKINRRDALKRIGKMAAAASIATVAPGEVLGAERKAEDKIPLLAYNSFYSSLAYKSYHSYKSYNSYRSYYSYYSYYS